MGWKVKIGMIFMIIGMTFLSQYVYAGVVETTKEEMFDNMTDIIPGGVPEIKGYQIQYGQPDGKNGYYHKLPEIQILHQDEGLVTKYRFYFPDGSVDEGEINSENKEKRWNDKSADGIYKLEMELIKEEEDDGADKKEEVCLYDSGTSEETGNNEETEEQNEELEKWKKKWEWKVDSEAPEIQLLKPIKTGIWYRSAVTIEAKCTEAFSDVADFSAYVNGTQYRSDDNENLIFRVNEEAKHGKGLSVILEAEDYAGNKSDVSFEILIDSHSPLLEIKGVEDYVITNQSVALKLCCFEENELRYLTAKVERETTSGEIEAYSVEKWYNEGEKSAEIMCEQDGIYKIQIDTVDLAGNRNCLKKVFTIDTSPPEIPALSDIDGKCMKEFVWKTNGKTEIQDFTTYTCIMSVDGMLYHIGERILREGMHTFSIKVTDAAGNEAEGRAEFEIDRTCPVIIVRNAETKEEIQPESRFEKKVDIEICPAQEQDWISQVVINGKEQMLTSRKCVQLELHTEKPYEIVIEAQDLAGNYSQRTMNLEIVEPEKRPIEMKRVIKNSLETDRLVPDEEKKASDIAKSRWYIWIVVGSVVFGFAIFICFKRFAGRSHRESGE